MATFPPSGFTIDALICDSVAAESGKLYVQGGGWNVLMSPVFPFRQPRIGFGAVVAVPYHQTNKSHELELKLENEDGEQISLGPEPTIKAQFTLGRPPHLPAGDAQNIPVAINLEQLSFEAPGAYAFVFSINGEEIERLSFRVTNPVGVVVTR